MTTDITTTPVISSVLVNGALTMSSREISDICGARHNDVVTTIERLFENEVLRESRKTTRAYRPEKGGRPTEVYDLTKRDTLVVVSGYNDDVRAKIIDRWIELEGVGRRSTFTVPKNFSEALRLAADQAEQIATLEPKALAFDSLINNGELPSLRTFFKQFHELNLTAIPATLGELGYLRRSDRYAGQWEVRRSHPRAAALFRQRINQGLKWNYVTVLLTPQGQEEMARLYRQGAFPKLARFSH